MLVDGERHRHIFNSDHGHLLYVFHRSGRNENNHDQHQLNKTLPLSNTFIRHLSNRYTRHEIIMDTSIVEEYLYQVILDKVNWYFMLITNWITRHTRMLYRNWILSGEKSGNRNNDEF